MNETNPDTLSPSTPRPLAVSVREAAKLVGIGKNQMYAAVANGEVPFKKIGARIIIPLAALERWLDQSPYGDPHPVHLKAAA